LWVSGLKKSTEEGRVYRLQVRGTEEGRDRLQAGSSLQRSAGFVCRLQVRNCLQKREGPVGYERNSLQKRQGCRLEAVVDWRQPIEAGRVCRLYSRLEAVYKRGQGS
jgi:hypothetical protein